MHRWTKNIYVTQDFYLSFSHACFCNKVKPLKKKHNPLYSFKGLPFSFYYIVALSYTVNTHTHTHHAMYCDFLKTIPLDFATPCYLGLQLMLFSTCNFVQLLLTQTCRCTEGKKRRKERTPQKPTTEPHRSVGTAEKNPRTFKNWERKFVAQNQRVHKCCQERPRTSCRKSLAAYSRLKGSPPLPLCT